MTLEEILKARGYTDADLEGLKPMLADARFRQSIEESYGAVLTEKEKLENDVKAWETKLEADFNPRMTKAEKEAMDARRELAAAREELAIAKDYGYLSDEEAARKVKELETARTRNGDPNGYDPKRHPTWDDTGKLLEGEARAIALANDLVMEYQYLTGKSLFEYETSIDGRTMRGLSAIREEARQNKKNIDQYMFEKFDFPGKRKAQAEAKQKEYDDRLIAQGRSQRDKEFAEQYGANPLLRTAMPSSRPAIPQPREGVLSPLTDEGGKISRIDRSQQRVARALETEAQVRSKAG